MSFVMTAVAESIVATVMPSVVASSNKRGRENGNAFRGSAPSLSPFFSSSLASSQRVHSVICRLIFVTRVFIAQIVPFHFTHNCRRTRLCKTKVFPNIAYIKQCNKSSISHLYRTLNTPYISNREEHPDRARMSCCYDGNHTRDLAGWVDEAHICT